MVLARFLIRQCSRNLSTYATPTAYSYDYGVPERPLLFETVGEVLRNSVERLPDRELFVVPNQDIRKTAAQFYEEANQLASGFVALGLQPKDRVGIWSPNHYEWLLTQYATAIAGLILVNVNPAYRVRELEYCLKKVNMKAIVIADKYKTQDFYETVFQLLPELATRTPGNTRDARLPDLDHIIAMGKEKKPGCWAFDDLMTAGDSKSWKRLKSEIEPLIQPDDAHNIQFTSGTTGNPKGATLSHFNVVNNAETVGRRAGYDKQHIKICLAPPLYHCLGCVLGSLAAVAHNCTLVLPSPTFSGAKCLEAIQKEKCNSLYGTPTMFIDILHHLESGKYDVSTLHSGTMAGAPCPEELSHKVINKLNMHKYTIGYGSTETSPASHQNHYTDSVDKKSSYVGIVGDHVEAKIVDTNGRVVPRGTRGELYVRGYLTMLGYWNDEAKTKEAMGQDRWYRTGDLCVMESDGYTKVVGRIKEMIIRGGENVYPAEIEQCFHEHPDVDDAQVIGVPDERMGEEVCVWIRLADNKSTTADELREYCRGKLSHFKVPKYILFKRGDEFPVTVTGKIQKFVMLEKSKEELGLMHVKPHL